MIVSEYVRGGCVGVSGASQAMFSRHVQYPWLWPPPLQGVGGLFCQCPQGTCHEINEGNLGENRLSKMGNLESLLPPSGGLTFPCCFALLRCASSASTISPVSTKHRTPATRNVALSWGNTYPSPSKERITSCIYYLAVAGITLRELGSELFSLLAGLDRHAKIYSDPSLGRRPRSPSTGKKLRDHDLNERAFRLAVLYRLRVYDHGRFSHPYHVKPDHHDAALLG